jgi:hypothetical protein
MFWLNWKKRERRADRWDLWVHTIVSPSSLSLTCWLVWSHFFPKGKLVKSTLLQFRKLQEIGMLGWSTLKESLNLKLSLSYPISIPLLRGTKAAGCTHTQPNTQLVSRKMRPSLHLHFIYPHPSNKQKTSEWEWDYTVVKYAGKNGKASSSSYNNMIILQCVRTLHLRTELLKV